MLTKKLFMVSFIALFFSLSAINGYANPFSIVKQKVKEQLIKEGYSADVIATMVRDKTPIANKLRKYLKSSCLIHNKNSYYSSGGFSGSTNYREVLEIRADGTFTMASNSGVAAGNNGVNGLSQGNNATLGYWNVFQGIDQRLILALKTKNKAIALFIITGYEGATFSIIGLGQKKRTIYSRIANSSC